mmetsp:Transcript_10938/g.33528  ORF Transcript_10938/g.33528 Transcript_10938/m.33528 type:complete len:3049 (+) Transcript_10938:220-9366(+)
MSAAESVSSSSASRGEAARPSSGAEDGRSDPETVPFIIEAQRRSPRQRESRQKRKSAPIHSLDEVAPSLSATSHALSSSTGADEDVPPSSGKAKRQGPSLALRIVRYFNSGVYSVVLAAFLIAGALLRANLFAGVYLLAFGVLALFYPYNFLPRRLRLAYVLTWILFLVSVLSVLGQGVVQIIYQWDANLFANQDTLVSILGYIGWQDFASLTTVESIALILPDALIALITFYLLIMFRFGLVFGRVLTKVPAAYLQPLSEFQGYIVLLLFFLAGVSVASILNLPYFIISMIGIVVLACKLSFLTVYSYIWWLCLPYTCLHILLVWFFQFDVIAENFPLDVAGLLGLYRYVDLDPSLAQNWFYPVGYLFVMLLFIFLTRLYTRTAILREGSKRPPIEVTNSEIDSFPVEEGQEASEESSLIPRQFSSGKLSPALTSFTSFISSQSSAMFGSTQDSFADRANRQLQLALGIHGWKIAFLGYLASAAFLPSLFTAAQLAYTFLMPFIPTKHFRKSFWVLLSFSWLFVFAQYIYNIQFGFPENDTLENIGLIPFDYVLPFLGLQCLVLQLLTLSWRYRDLATEYLDKKDRILDQLAAAVGDNLSNADSSTPIAWQQRANQSSVIPDSSQLVRSIDEQQGRFSDTSSDDESDLETSELSDVGSIRSSTSGGMQKAATRRRPPPLTKQTSVFGFAPEQTVASMLWDKIKNSKVYSSMSSSIMLFFLFIADQSDLIVYASLYVCGLTSISLLNAGYMIFFVVFISLPRLAARSWIVLVFYTELVILTIVVWQVSWTKQFDSVQAVELVGLRHYGSFSSLQDQKPWGLWGGIFWHLAILFFALLHLLISGTLDKGLLYHIDLIRGKRSHRTLVMAAVQESGVDESGSSEDDDPLNSFEPPSKQSDMVPLLAARSSEPTPRTRLQRSPPQRSTASARSRSSSSAPALSAATTETHEEQPLARLPKPLRAAVLLLWASWHHGLLFMVYLTFVLVSTLDTFSLISVVYLLFVFVCAIVHHFATDRSRAWLRFVWPALVLISALILVVRYLYQFQWMSDLLGDLITDERYLQMLGLYHYDVSDEFFPTALMRELAGGTAVYVVVVLQLHSFAVYRGGHLRLPGVDDEQLAVEETALREEEIRQQEVEHLERLRSSTSAAEQLSATGKPKPRVPRVFVAPSLLRSLDAFWHRFVVLHAAKLLQLTLWLVAIYHVDAIHAPYVLVLVLTTHLRRGPDLLGSLLLLYVQLVLLSQYLFRFADDYADALSDWFGYRFGGLCWSDSAATDSGVVDLACASSGSHAGVAVVSLFDAVVGDLGVLVALLLLRYAYVWEARFWTSDGSPAYDPEHSSAQEASEAAVRLSAGSTLHSGVGDDAASAQMHRAAISSRLLVSLEGREPCTLFTTETRGFLDGSRAQPSTLKNNLLLLRDTLGWYLSNWFRLHGAQVFLLLILVTVFERNNVLSVLYLAVLGLFTLLPQTRARSYLPLVVGWLALALLVQYLLLLGLPPVNDIAFPWDSWNPTTNPNGEHLAQLQQYLAFRFHSSELSADFALFFVAALLLRWDRCFSLALSSSRDAQLICESGHATDSDSLECGELHRSPLNSLRSLESGEATAAEGRQRSLSSSSSESDTRPLLARLELSDADDARARGQGIEQLSHEEAANITALFFSSTHDFTRSPRDWVDTVKFYALMFSRPVILVVVFIAGTAEVDVFSFGYVALALGMMYVDLYVHPRRNQFWSYARYYNFFLMALQTFYQFVYIPAPSASSIAEGTPWEEVIGFRKLFVWSEVSTNQEYLWSYESDSWTGRGAIYDVIIFVLLSAQMVVFRSPDFQRIVAYVCRKEERARIQAEALAAEKMAATREAYATMYAEKVRRANRCAELRKQREARMNFYGKLAQGELELEQQQQQQQQTSLSQSDGANKMAMAARAMIMTRRQMSTRFLLENAASKDQQSMGDTASVAASSTAPSATELAAARSAQQQALRNRGSGRFAAFRDQTMPLPKPAPALRSSATLSAGKEETKKEAEEEHPQTGTKASKDSREPASFRDDEDATESDASSDESGSERESSLSVAADASRGVAATVAAPAAADDTGELLEMPLLLEDGPASSAQTQPEMSTDHDKDAQAADQQSWLDKVSAGLRLAWRKTKEWSDLGVDSVYQAGTRKKRDRAKYGRARALLRALFDFLERNSYVIVYLTFIANATASGNLLSLMYPLAAFGFAVLEYPMPPAPFWTFILSYSSVVIVLKFFFTLIGIGTSSTLDSLSWLGLSTINPPFLQGVVWDLVLWLAVLWHKHMLKQKGFWTMSRDELKSAFPSRALTALQKEQGLADAQRAHTHGKRDPGVTTEIETVLAGGSEPISGSSSSSGGDGEQSGSGDGDASARRRRARKPGRRTRRRLKREQSEGESDANDLISIDQDAASEHGEGTGKDSSADGEKSLASAQSGVREVFARLIGYYKDILGRECPDSGDYYLPILLIDVFSFIFLLLFQQEFTGIPSEEIPDFISDGRIPRQYLLLLFLQFVLLVLERALYLSRSITGKLVLQYVLLFVYHFLLFYYLPTNNGVPFTRSWQLIVFYLMKSCYFWLSGLQIRRGYPIVIDQRFLTKDTNRIRYYAFQLYRAIPFVYEMRCLLDWTIHETTLGFYMWLKFEDIYAQLYETQYRVDSYERDDRKHGEPQEWYMKLFIGVGIFLGLALLLWFPLFLLSSANPNNQPNPIIAASMTVSFEGWEPIYSMHTSQDFSDFSKSDYATLNTLFPWILPDEQRDTQLVPFPPYSEVQWGITPPSRNNFLQALGNPRINISMVVEFSFTRQAPSDALTLSVQFPAVKGTPNFLSQEDQEHLYQIISSPNLFASDGVLVKNLYPRAVRLPNTGSPTFPSSRKTPIDVQFVDAYLIYNRTLLQSSYVMPDGHENHVSQLVEYWVIEQAQLNNTLAASLFESIGPEVVVVSAEILTGISAIFATASLIGLYLGLVLAIGRFIRMAVTDIYPRIPYEDMIDPKPIMSLVEDVIIARQHHELELEENLYWELIELYRSPETIVEVTKGNGNFERFEVQTKKDE